MRPHWSIILKIVGKVTAEIMTSLPLGNSNALRASKPAELPELVRTAYFTPRNLAVSDENNLPSSASCQFLVLRDFLIDLIIARSSSSPVTAPPYFKIFFMFLLVYYRIP